MSHNFYHCGQGYKTTPPAAFDHAGHRYEARLIRLCRGMFAAYVYDHTTDMEAVVSSGDMFCPSLDVTMPEGQTFRVSATFGDWLEYKPAVFAVDLIRRVA